MLTEARVDLLERVLTWFSTGQEGLSSKAMALQTCGIINEGDYPHDPDDLNRCLLLMEAIPEVREALPKMRELGPVWSALVDRWDEIERTFLAEAGYNWTRRRRAAQTYQLMQFTIRAAGG